MKILTKNKYSYLNYEIYEEFEAGIALKWYEVKSIKTWKIDIKDSIIKIRENEAFLINMNVPLYEKTSIKLVPNYSPKQNRKLLLKKRELNKLMFKTKRTGLVIIPLKVYINKRGLIKLTIGLGKLRKKVEKKQIIKERDVKRQAQKEIKNIWY